MFLVSNVTEYIEFEDKIITASTDVELLKKEHEKGNPILLILDDSNRKTDTSFAKFAVQLENDCNSQQLLGVLDENYLRLIVSRNNGEPIEILKTGRLFIREICPDDCYNIYRVFDESEGYIESFFNFDRMGLKGVYDEIRAVLSDYINNVYDFYGYGIWAVCLLDGSFIGIAGLTPREDMAAELGYALLKEYRHNGYAYEACDAIIKHCCLESALDGSVYDEDNNSEDDLFIQSIVIRVSSENEPGTGLAAKLAKNHSNVRVLKYE